MLIIFCYVFASERSERGNLQRLLRHPLKKYSEFLAMTSNVQSLNLWLLVFVSW